MFQVQVILVISFETRMISNQVIKGRTETRQKQRFLGCLRLFESCDVESASENIHQGTVVLLCGNFTQNHVDPHRGHGKHKDDLNPAPLASVQSIARKPSKPAKDSQ